MRASGLSWPARLLAVTLLAGAVTTGAVTPPAVALDMTVDDPRVFPDSDPGDGQCIAEDFGGTVVVPNVCTLRAALDESNATPAVVDTITILDLNPDQTQADISRNGPFEITAPVNIQGVDRDNVRLTPIPSGGEFPTAATTVFAIDSPGVVQLSNMTIYGRDGTGIDNDGSRRLHGGVIRYCAQSGSALSIDDVTFEDNVVGGFGGAIAFFLFDDVDSGDPLDRPQTLDSSLGIAGARFENNTAQQGGAVAVIEEDCYPVLNRRSADSTSTTPRAPTADGVVNIDADFENNSALTTSGEGGALYVQADMQVNLAGRWANNTAERRGGAVYVTDASTLTVSGAMSGNQSTGNNGGAIWAGGCTDVDVTTTQFTGNSADDDGGAIFLGGCTASDALLAMAGAAFHGNSAGNYGGAIALREDTFLDVGDVADPSAVTTFGDDVDGGNTADSGGGAIIAQGDVALLHAAFGSNTAGDGPGGGLLHCVPPAGDAIYEDVTFDGNVATDGGGAEITVLDQFADTGLVLDTVRFTNNRVNGVAFTSGGGGVRVDEESFCINDDRRSPRGEAPQERPGRAAPAVPGTIDIEGAIVTDNRASNDGGGLRLDTPNATITITDSQINRNWTFGASHGGGLFADGELTLERVFVNDNRAGVDPTIQDPDGDLSPGDGGGVYSDFDHVTIIGPSGFNRNRAGGDGGAIHALTVDADLGFFTENRAQFRGGAVQLYNDGTSSFHDSNFARNQANSTNANDGDGGAISVSDIEGAGDLIITASTFTSNVARPNANGFGGGDGGALHLRSLLTTTLGTPGEPADAVVFTDNEGNDGGAVWSEQGVDAHHSSFVDNRARGDGGALFLDTQFSNSTADLSTVDIVENTAGLRGGGIFVSGVDSTLVDVDVSGNVAPVSGGGIHVQGVLQGSDVVTRRGSVTMVQSALIGNESLGQSGDGGEGGGLFVDSVGSASLRSTTVSDNEAVRGGGIFNQGELELTRSTLAFNRAPGVSGKALDNTSGLVVMDHTLIACHPDPDNPTSCILGNAVTRGNNMTDDQSCVIVQPGDIVNFTDPNEFLGVAENNDGFEGHEDIGVNPLRNNGGRTLTHSLRPGSRAIDFGVGDPGDDGDAPDCPPSAPEDQRGVLNTDGDGDGVRSCDVGAFEFIQGVSVTRTADAHEVGPSDGIFTLTRSGDIDAPLTVQYAVDGTATPGDDYFPLTGSVVFGAGVATATIAVTPVPDDLDEIGETVQVTLRPGPDHTLGSQSSATLVILEETPDAVVALTATDDVLRERDADGDPDHGEFTLTRSGDPSQPLDVFFDVRGTATEGLDYLSLPRVARFGVGVVAVTVPVLVLDDDVDDGGERVTLEVLPRTTYAVAPPAAVSLRILETDADSTVTAGTDRVDTAVAVSKSQFVPGEVEAVVLARSDDYPDALAGGPLASLHRGPVLLTETDGLLPAVAAEIQRLEVPEVIVLGGTAALSDDVVEQLEDLGVEVERVGGADRFATAALIAAQLPDGSEAYLTEGADPDLLRGWPDAVAVSALASHQLRPILLTTTEELPAATEDALEERGITDVVIVGGTVAVNNDVRDRLRELDITVLRRAGETRYDTSRLVADDSVDAGLDPSRTWLATGRNFVDALVAGPAVANDGGVLLLTDGIDLENTPPILDWIADLEPPVLVRIIGGPAAVNDTVRSQIDDLIGAVR